MVVTFKAVPCVLKDLRTDPSILCFLHPPPASDFQVPKGTVEPGEQIEDAAHRELFEESGIPDARLLGKIGTFDFFIRAGQYRFLEDELQHWHLFHMEVSRPLPDQWVHTVTGEGDETGMEYAYFWESLQAIRTENYRQHYLNALQLVRRYLEQGWPL